MKTIHDLRAPERIVIVGAGPAGLMLARLLQTQGFAVSVYERDASPTARPQGGSLDLRPSLGQRAVAAAGLEREVAAVSRSEARAFRLMDGQGNLFPDAGGETHEDAGPEIDRGDLRGLLIASLEPGTIRRGHTVTEVQPQGDGRWRIAFADGAPVIADLVIGADGIGSKVRARLTTARPHYVGHTMLAAVIRRDLWRNSALSDMLGEGSMMLAGHEKTIFVQRCSKDLILLYFSMKVAENWPVSEGLSLSDTGAVLAEVHKAYADFSPDLMAMLTDIEGEFQRWPLAVMPPDTRWDSQPGLTMIGDASHGMPPFTGKGVNLALFDALQLAEALTTFPDGNLHEAVRSFEAQMQAQTRRETGECLTVGQMYYGIHMGFDTAAAA